MVRRLFVDPGSNSCGWAVFDDDRLVSHGTVEPEGKLSGARLAHLMSAYKEIAEYWRPDELYVERMNRVVNVVVIWAVAAVIIGVVLGTFGECEVPTYNTKQISPSEWKSYDKVHNVFNTYRDTTASNDEVVAILMGLIWLEKNSDVRKSG